MSQKDDIIESLRINPVMTQLELSEALYGDRKHGPNIYGALTSLVSNNIVTRTGSNPSYYSLGDVDFASSIIITKNTLKTKYRDVSKDIINNDTLEESENLVMMSPNYGPENELITSCLQKYDKNIILY